MHMKDLHPSSLCYFRRPQSQEEAYVTGWVVDLIIGTMAVVLKVKRRGSDYEVSTFFF